ncbi:hypothetical protein [Shouchella lehensis]|uniref:Uncharacterized protein n=1 Tax=Shouchella lehensis TaxID=300825 RepID=A0A4Y7WE56_9BACI|nr:hypothetical protein [Shouchella lehensis]MBG9783566.1 hypothetical protein [Shouchella lehensis]TES45680.1 hypothetical protein E2L03_20060 [Shouchella lehensis]
MELTAEIKMRCIALVQENYESGLSHTLIDRSFFRDFESLKSVIALELYKHGFKTLSIQGDLLVTKF